MPNLHKLAKDSDALEEAYGAVLSALREKGICSGECKTCDNHSLWFKVKKTDDFLQRKRHWLSTSDKR